MRHASTGLDLSSPVHSGQAVMLFDQRLEAEMPGATAYFGIGGVVPLPRRYRSEGLVPTTSGCRRQPDSPRPCSQTLVDVAGRYCHSRSSVSTAIDDLSPPAFTVEFATLDELFDTAIGVRVGHNDSTLIDGAYSRGLAS